MSESALQQSQRHFVVRGNHQGSGSISPIERWPDQNYAPKVLHHLHTFTATTFQIVTGLHGCPAEAVQVDLARGCVIILIAADADSASPARSEFYCEVPIPAGTNPNVARVEIARDFVIVSLDRKKPSLFQRASAEIMRLKNASALLFGNGRPIHLSDDERTITLPRKLRATDEDRG